MIGDLGSRLRNAIRSFASKGRIDEKELSELVKELQRVLIASDVDVRLVLELSKRIKSKSLEEKPLPGLTLKEHVLRVVYDELVALVGKGIEIPIKKDIKIVLVGLFGSGKTTTAGKIGYWLKKKGVEPTLVSLDRDRPAAYEQLIQLGKSVGLKVNDRLVNPPEIVDTAGRDALSDEMLKAAKKIVNEVKPDHVFLVVPAEMGHEAGKQAQAFKGIVTGVIITKTEGTAKGGGALSACSNASVPVAFIGTGERIEELEVFDPQRYVSRLLGWGDLKGLMEKAEEIKGDLGEVNLEKLNMVSFYKQMEAMTKMGPFEKVLQMVGLTDLDKGTVEDMKVKLKKYKAMIDSMTNEEKHEPEIISGSRAERIAKGSGTSSSDVRRLLKEFSMMKKMVKKISKGGTKGFDLKALRSMKFR